LVGHDVTELEQAQERALQAERLAAIGQMMTGLAHESRNALQRTVACLERLRWMLAGPPQALELLNRAQRAQEDLVRLFEDVRSYAAPLRITAVPCDLAGAWREAWENVRGQFPDQSVRLEEETAGADLRCQADRYRLRQVFGILLENSLAAGAARVRIVAEPAEVGGRPALRVTVRDDGEGLNEEQRRRLFEPFFTTKVKGTGLGLAIARRIVEAHGGQIAVADKAPPGAEIVLVLPRGEP
jgi:signal transduction histidine kinase